MGLLIIIRRMHLREMLSIRESARRTGLSRNTVTKHLAVNTIEPRFATPERPRKLDPFSEKLAGWLKTETGKSRKQRRTLQQMHADLVKLGFTGSYNCVAAFARDWRADRQREQPTTGRGTFVPLSFSPGGAFQYDWCDDFAILRGEAPSFRCALLRDASPLCGCQSLRYLRINVPSATDIGPKHAAFSLAIHHHLGTRSRCCRRAGSLVRRYAI